MLAFRALHGRFPFIERGLRITFMQAPARTTSARMPSVPVRGTSRAAASARATRSSLAKHEAAALGDKRTPEASPRPNERDSEPKRRLSSAVPRPARLSQRGPLGLQNVLEPGMPGLDAAHDLCGDEVGDDGLVLEEAFDDAHRPGQGELEISTAIEDGRDTAASRPISATSWDWERECGPRQ